MLVYIKDNFDNLQYTDFIILLSISIPIIRHEKSLSYTRFEPQLVEFGVSFRFISHIVLELYSSEESGNG